MCSRDWEVFLWLVGSFQVLSRYRRIKQYESCPGWIVVPCIIPFHQGVPPVHLCCGYATVSTKYSYMCPLCIVPTYLLSGYETDPCIWIPHPLESHKGLYFMAKLSSDSENALSIYYSSYLAHSTITVDFQLSIQFKINIFVASLTLTSSNISLWTRVKNKVGTVF